MLCVSAQVNPELQCLSLRVRVPKKYVYSLAPKFLCRDYFKAKSIYCVGTWALRVSVQQAALPRSRETERPKSPRLSNIP